MNGTVFPSRVNLGCQPASELPEEKVAVSHFERFNPNLFFLLHAAMWSIASWATAIALFLSWSDAQIDRSSMNRAWLAGRSFVMSSMKSRNSSGATTEPCGTPCFISTLLLFVLPKRTLACLLVRNEANHLMNFAGMPLSN